MKRYIPITIALSLSILVAIVVFSIWRSRGQIIVQDLTKYRYPVGAGPCGGMTLFDQLGNSYDYFDSNYSGPAPLYLLSYERLQPIVTQHDRMGCLLIPKTITPSVALQGQAYYPLVIETSRPEGWMSLGESKTLSVTVRISRNFTNFKTDFAVPFTITDQIRTRFRLDTTTFNFSPPNDGPEIHIIDALQMAEQSWIISPKEGTLGKQSLVIHLIGERPLLKYIGVQLNFEIRTIGGIHPLLAAFLGMVSTFLIAAFTIAKLLPETWKLYANMFIKQEQSDNSNSTKKKRNPRNK